MGDNVAWNAKRGASLCSKTTLRPKISNYPKSN